MQLGVQMWLTRWAAGRVRVTAGSHDCVGMHWSIKVDGSPFTLNGVTSSVAELNYGSVGLRWVPLRCVACGESLIFFYFSRGYASVSQLNLLSRKYYCTGACQSDHVYAHVSRARSSKLCRWSYLYLKVVYFTFFCLDFFLSYREIDNVKCTM